MSGRHGIHRHAFRNQCIPSGRSSSWDRGLPPLRWPEVPSALERYLMIEQNDLSAAANLLVIQRKFWLFKPETEPRSCRRTRPTERPAETVHGLWMGQIGSGKHSSEPEGADSAGDRQRATACGVSAYAENRRARRPGVATKIEPVSVVATKRLVPRSALKIKPGIGRCWGDNARTDALPVILTDQADNRNSLLLGVA